MIKPAAKSDIRNALFGIPKQITACFEPEHIQEIHRGLVQIMLEDEAAFTAAYVSRGCDLIQ